MRSGNRQPNVLLVTVDCLRRDRLSAYGHERRTTPFLDGLLDRSVHCTSAHSTSSWTCPSVASFLTGLYPHNHGGGLVPGEPKNLSKQNLPTALPPEVETLPEILGQRGYSTAAISAVWNAHLPVPGRFDEMAILQKPAPKLVRRSLDWMAAQEDPFFLWLHLGDAHEPLDVPRSLRDAFGRVPRTTKARRWDFTTSGADVTSEAFERFRDTRIRLYDASVLASDQAIAELWGGVMDLGRANDTLLVVTSDHGEEFWEHREEEIHGFSDPRDIYGTGHGHNLFQVHLLVPLIVAGPGIAPKQIDRNVSLVDISPTVLQAVEGEASDLDGQSLLEDGSVDRAVVAEAVAYGFDKKSVVMGDEKLLVSEGDGYEKAFRLGLDRREVEGITDEQRVARLRRHLPGEGRPIGKQLEATKEILGHLRGLGYIE